MMKLAQRHGAQPMQPAYASEKPKAVVACEYCGLEVRKLTLIEVHQLASAEPEKVGVGALECKNCKVVLFEDELKDGKFIPHFWVGKTSERKKTKIPVFRN